MKKINFWIGVCLGLCLCGSVLVIAWGIDLLRRVYSEPNAPVPTHAQPVPESRPYTPLEDLADEETP